MPGPVVDPAILAFALAAGSVAALNPCGFAMLPAYLALIVSGDGGVERGRLVALGRALAATAMMTAGFLLVFGGFGLALAPVLGAAQQRRGHPRHGPWRNSVSARVTAGPGRRYAVTATSTVSGKPAAPR